MALGRDGIVVVRFQHMRSRTRVVSKSSYSIFYSTSFFTIRSDGFLVNLHESFYGMGVASLNT